MNKPTTVQLAVRTTLVAAALGAFALPAAADEGNGLEEIIVTASKREERLIDAPIAISALSTESLERLGVQGFSDYMSLVPNLSQAVGGAPGYGTIIMRGMYSGSAQITGTSAYYIGDTPLTPSGPFGVGAFSTPDPDVLDVDRVEVLKGPQGTLYGASSLGGLIRIIPSKPDLNDFSGKARLDLNSVDGGEAGYGLRASANVPLIKDRLGVRFAIYNRLDGGFVRNTFNNRDNLGETQSQGGSITLRYQPTESLDFTARYMSQSLDTPGFLAQDHEMASDRPLVAERTLTAAFEGGVFSDTDLYELSMNWETAAGALTATVAKAKYELNVNSDATRTYGALLVGFAPPGFYVPAYANPNVDKFTSEVRFASKRFGAFEFLLGGFYTDEENDYLVNIGVVSTPPLPAPFNNLATSNTFSNYKEKAVYGNATFYFTDSIDLTAGLRYSENDQDACVESPPGIISLGNYCLDNFSDDSTTYQVTARWRPTENMSTYARVSTGYRPGGPQATNNLPPGGQLTYDADTVTNYEVGFKAQSSDRRWSFDSAVYYIDWKDIQLNEIFGGVVILGNAGGAKIKGIELQGDWAPVAGLTLGAAFGYNDAKLTDIGGTTAIALGAQQDDQLPGSPKVTASLYGDYRIELSSNWGLTLGATARYQGDKEAAYSGDETVALNPQYTIPAYETFDARATLSNGKFGARFYVNNLTDENGITGYVTSRIIPIPTPSQAFIIRPRTYGVTLSYDF